MTVNNEKSRLLVGEYNQINWELKVKQELLCNSLCTDSGCHVDIMYVMSTDFRKH